MKVILWISPEMGCILKNIMHESFMHVFLYIGVLFIFVHFWLGVLCERFPAYRIVDYCADVYYPLCQFFRWCILQYQ